MKKLLIAALVFWTQWAMAATDSTTIFVSQILHDTQKTYAINQLIAKQDPATFPLLSAINNKKLYLLNNQAVTTGEKTASATYEIYSLYPKNELLVNTNGQPLHTSIDALTVVEINRSDRLLLNGILPMLEIFNPEPAKRMLAYGQLKDSHAPNRLDMLRMALARESNKDALRAGKDILYYLELNTTTDASTAQLYIDSLAENWGDNAPVFLSEYAKTNKPQAAYAATKALELEHRYDYLQKVQNLFSGLSLGSILILIALGLSIVYGLAGIINMAHGEFLMIGAYTTYCIQTLFTDVLKIPYTDLLFIISLPLSFLVAGLLGLLLERLVVRHLYARPLESLLATWGVSLILIQTARSLFGDLTAVKTPAFLSGGLAVSPHLVLPYNRIFIIGLTALIVALTYFMLYKTRLGLQIRAVTQNRGMSACLGIDTKRVAALTFFFGSGLAGIAGCAMTLIGNVVPDMGQTYIVDSFLVVVTGGVGKIVGTIVSGLGIGFFTKILEAFFQAVYGKVCILLFIMLFMQYKPKGLFPYKGRLAED
ncbi:urea ABC transporter permease subunit UrtB [Chitinophaga sancti]|uniref:urea ABC transporter permease subunit UrtB n=1 Tax=Chitinophaga sancti TaxID=1004 RepID=UPI002A74934F|nr:urea ABC transporter permease subunit UrtB [Chitinophaga sancti]WPQ61583.1 urea ABC transporter permease subunit UrtB [Chitinophaga sancti]